MGVVPVEDDKAAYRLAAFGVSYARVQAHEAQKGNAGLRFVFALGVSRAEKLG
jgi:hypothetical protein